MKTCPIIAFFVVLMYAQSFALGPEEVPTGLGPVGTALKARLEAPVSSKESSSAKSSALAFGLSLLVPGAGQAYEGRWKSALIFLGVEAASWTGWYIWREEGKDKEREYKNFADEHWSLERFTGWQTNYCRNYSEREDTCYISWWTHVLPKQKDQEYYEMIGKYDQFAAGWEDFPEEWLSDPIPGDSLETFCKRWKNSLRERYEDMREESNRYLKRAGYMMGLVLVNRVISAIFSLRGAEGGAQVEVVPGKDGPVLTASWRFR